MHQMFVSDHPNLEKKVKGNFYYNCFKENFYSFRRPQMDARNEGESLVIMQEY